MDKNKEGKVGGREDRSNIGGKNRPESWSGQVEGMGGEVRGQEEVKVTCTVYQGERRSPRSKPPPPSPHTRTLSASHLTHKPTHHLLHLTPLKPQLSPSIFFSFPLPFSFSFFHIFASKQLVRILSFLTQSSHLTFSFL